MSKNATVRRGRSVKLTKNSFSYEDLIECAHGKLFGPGNAQLPLPPMLMLDRVTSITEDGGEHGKGQIIAELDIKPDMWFFPCHFENDPVMPGCLGLDAMWQLVGFFLGWLGGIGRGRALGVDVLLQSIRHREQHRNRMARESDRAAVRARVRVEDARSSGCSVFNDNLQADPAICSVRHQPPAELIAELCP